MKLYYTKNRYAVDNTLYIGTWCNDEGFFEPYGDVTVNLSAYGMMPKNDSHIFIPTYKMTSDYIEQVLNDIVEEVITEVPIGLGRGLYVRLKENWEEGVEMMKGEEA